MNIASPYTCGESEEVHQAWNDARTAVRYRGGSWQDEITESSHAAAETGADDQTTTCIAFVSGVATGQWVCTLVDHIAQNLVSHGKSVEDAHQWLEDAVQKKYTWYMGYDHQCGNRPEYTMPEEEGEEGTGEEGSGEEGSGEEGSGEEGSGEEGSGEEGSGEEGSGEEGSGEEGSGEGDNAGGEEEATEEEVIENIEEDVGEEDGGEEDGGEEDSGEGDRRRRLQ